jgi:hypothetical protein
MPQPYQAIRKDLMARVRILVEHQKVLRRPGEEPIRVRDVLNEVIERGLEVVAAQRGVILPPLHIEALRKRRHEDGTGIGGKRA